MNNTFKLLSVVVVVISLIGCGRSVSPVEDETKPIKGVDTISTLCLNGVQYYFYARSSWAGMAVAIDNETLQPIRCSLENKNHDI